MGPSFDCYGMQGLISALKGHVLVVMTNVNTLLMAKAQCEVLTHLTFLLVIQESVNGMLIVSANGMDGTMSI